MPGVEKTYESLTKQLIYLGNEEGYNERRSPDAMDCDALEKDNPEAPATGAEPPNGYSQQDWDSWTAKRSGTLEAKRRAVTELESEADWLGKARKGKGKGRGKGGKGWQPSGASGVAASGPRDMSQVECAW